MPCHEGGVSNRELFICAEEGRARWPQDPHLDT